VPVVVGVVVASEVVVLPGVVETDVLNVGVEVGAVEAALVELIVVPVVYSINRLLQCI